MSDWVTYIYKHAKMFKTSIVAAEYGNNSSLIIYAANKQKLVSQMDSLL